MRHCHGTDQFQILCDRTVAAALAFTTICSAEGGALMRLHAAACAVLASATVRGAIVDSGSRRDQGREQELNREQGGETGSEQNHDVRSTQIFCAALAPNCTGAPPTRKEKVSS